MTPKQGDNGSGVAGRWSARRSRRRTGTLRIVTAIPCLAIVAALSTLGAEVYAGAVSRQSTAPNGAPAREPNAALLGFTKPFRIQKQPWSPTTITSVSCPSAILCLAVRRGG
jgi:hypothetical protein